MPDGKMFHSITYGRMPWVVMPMHLPRKSWQIILYINSMQDAWLASNQPAQTQVAETDVNPETADSK